MSESSDRARPGAETEHPNVAIAASEPELGFVREGAGGRFTVHAAALVEVEIEIYAPGGERPLTTLALESVPSADPAFQLWSAAVATLPERFEYVVRVDGGAPLVDPYARQLAGGEVWGRATDAVAPGVGRRYRGWVDAAAFDWEGVERPRVAEAERVIYELHVRGFTRHASSGVAHPGTYLGVVEKIDALRELGVTTVELMPVAEFDETENPRRNPATGERLLNFWGYSPVSFMAPKAGYASSPEPGRAALELREMVRELHRVGIEVIVDVVFNHTAEGAGGATDPVHSWRGLDERAYYLIAAATGESLDYTGCGNTVNVNHPVTRRLVVDALRHWCEAYQVDGFRFDLAAAFFRGEEGETLARPPLLDAIAADPVLRDRILIAEPWDARGFSPPGGFPAPWREWDGEFRDELRRWVGGLERDPRPLARRLAGRGPQGGKVAAARAIRFAACHDGRPLADVVAYATKGNGANGEGNYDGWGGEVAWNGGVEGATADPALQSVRQRELRALVALLAVAPGTLQLTAGDERLRSQLGNNNVWCQDNELGWVDWTPTAEGEPFRNFLRRLLQLRRDWLSEPTVRRAALIEPFTEAGERDLAGPGSAFLLLAANPKLEPCWCVAANAGSTPVRFPLPGSSSGARWRLRLDTARPAGQEIFFADEAPFLAFETTHLAVQPRAVRILTAEALPLRPE